MSPSPTTAGPGLDYLAEFAAAAEWFADHVGRTPMRAAVPTCPGWTVLDLVTHLGNVHAWAASVVETGRAAHGLDDRPPSARPRRVAEWYVAKAEDLYAVLLATPADTPCWNFAFGAGDAAFWQRRQTHEALVHGIDLALAGHHEVRLPAGIAADGVDEALGVFLHRMHRRGHAADLTHPLCLRADDVDRSWVVEPAPRGTVPAQHSAAENRPARPAPRVSDGDRPGADGLTGPADALLRVLWKRQALADADLEVTGDRARVERFLASRLTA